MRYRPLGKSGLLASEVGLGCEHLQGKPLGVIQSVVDAALDGGINIFDVFMSEPDVRQNLGAALKGRRDRVLLQGHIGAAWLDGQYERTRDPGHVRFFFEDFLKRLQTDYVDIGMLHFVDTQKDLESVLSSGMLDYACELKEKGVIRLVGVSSHDPAVSRQLVDTGRIDVLMFSLNPAFDALPSEADIDALFAPETYRSQGTLAIAPQRARLYQECEAKGVAITVMKGLGGGALLYAKRSPYGVALSVSQCIQYALTRPAVASVLVGCASEKEVWEAVAHGRAGEEDRDFAAALTKSPVFSLKGQCMYCNHCLPCPAQIDIAQVNKYLDLAELSGEIPATVRAHYAALEKNAADCVACGACEERCPFGVPVIERMERAVKRFE